MFLIYVFIQQGHGRVRVLFLSEDPFYWDSIHIVLFFFILFTVAAFEAYPGTLILRPVMADLVIVSLSLICKLLSSTVLAFAKTDVPVYLGKYSCLAYFQYLHESSPLEHIQTPIVLFLA